MKNLVVRAVSGAVYVAVFVACILAGVTYFTLLVGLLMIVGITEFLNLTIGKGRFLKQNILYYVAALAIPAGYIISSFVNPSPFIGLAIPGLWVALLFYSTFRNDNDGIRNTAMSLLSLFYITLPLVAISLPYIFDSTIILVSLIGIWINDTGAYCVGSMFGRHRLCERLSPKKSWEGFWGGMAFVVIAAVIYAAVAGLNIFAYAAYGIALSVFATVGDLFESRLKREAGVKDSGRIIPGHGGILDRIDSFLFVSYLIIFATNFLQ